LHFTRLIKSLSYLHTRRSRNERDIVRHYVIICPLIILLHAYNTPTYAYTANNIILYYQCGELKSASRTIYRTIRRARVFSVHTLTVVFLQCHVKSARPFARTRTPVRVHTYARDLTLLKLSAAVNPRVPLLITSRLLPMGFRSAVLYFYTLRHFAVYDL